MKRLGRLLAENAARAPHARALSAPGGDALTYDALLARVEDLAEVLDAAGIRGGDRVALVMPNGPEMLVAFLGIAARAACAPLNPAFQADEFDRYLADLRPKALLLLENDASPAASVARARAIPLLTIPVPVQPASAGSPVPVQPASAGSPVSVQPASAGSPVPVQPASAGSPVPAPDTALILHTSGTTSRPKMVPLTHANICASAWNIARALELTAADRYLNVMPLFHIQGLMASLATLVSGGEVIATGGFDAERFFDWWREFRPTWYSEAPTIHQAVLALAPLHREVIRGHPLRFLRSSAAPLPRQVAAELERDLGVPVIEGYGSTETCLQATCTPMPPRVRKAGSVGLPAGPQVAIMGESGDLLPRGATGEIVVRGENVTPGYLEDGDATRRAFRDGWFRTGDLGSFNGDGYLYVTGRIKDIINRGGEKIAPREVEEVLLLHPAVAQAVAFPAPHPSLGEDVAAAVVLHQGSTASEADIRLFAAGRLALFRVPRHIFIVPEISSSASGKLQRELMAARFAPRCAPGRETQAASPPSPMEQFLLGIWRQALGRSVPGVLDSFFDAGGDSVMAGMVIGRVRDELGVELSFRELFEAPTVAELAAILERRVRA